MSLPYAKIVTNHDAITQSELNIDNKVRSNLFAWNGQFSPQFIETLLANYGKEADIVFDPFLGSGTVLYEAGRKQLSAFGTELNVSAFFMAKVYEMINCDLKERQAVLFEVEAVISSIIEDDQIISIITEKVSAINDSYIKTLLSTLIILLDIYNNPISMDLLNKKWIALKETVIALPYSKEQISAYMGDARMVPRADNSASLLITSPPYINVFNYHQKYRRSVEALGFDVLATAKKEFGSNRKNRGNRLLTVVQYTIDMALSLKEACRICSSGSRMIYVVGRESSVLGYSFCNSQLVYEICTEIFDLPFLLKQERFFKNRYGQMIYEDILHFSCFKPASQMMDTIIIQRAKTIAIRMLEKKKRSCPENKNHLLLEEAITRATQVKESEE